MNTKERETIDIETSGNGVTINLKGRHICEVHIDGDGAATYRVDGRESEKANWVQGTRADYTGSARYDDYIETGWAQLRIQCTSGTATAGDSATVVLCAGGR